MAIASEAVLTALDFYIGRGGGSRGARAVLDPLGESAPEARAEDLSRYRFRAERSRTKTNR